MEKNGWQIHLWGYFLTYNTKRNNIRIEFSDIDGRIAQFVSEWRYRRNSTGEKNVGIIIHIPKIPQKSPTFLKVLWPYSTNTYALFTWHYMCNS